MMALARREQRGDGPSPGTGGATGWAASNGGTDDAGDASIMRLSSCRLPGSRHCGCFATVDDRHHAAKARDGGAARHYESATRQLVTHRQGGRTRLGCSRGNRYPAYARLPGPFGQVTPGRRRVPPAEAVPASRVERAERRLDAPHWRGAGPPPLGGSESRWTWRGQQERSNT
jgi:hypothetical protein